MAVPKKKTAKSASRTRRSTYISLQRKRLLNITNIVKDKETGETSLNHRLPAS
jgi:ribosomal protein L32